MHEGQEIAHAGGLDFLKFGQNLADVRLLEHPDERRHGLDELERLLVLGLVFQRRAWQFVLEPGDHAAKLGQLAG